MFFVFKTPQEKGIKFSLFYFTNGNITHYSFIYIDINSSQFHEVTHTETITHITITTNTSNKSPYTKNTLI